MRQGNGSDLLGANNPRSATIGIVYVAPGDDRESVQAAILTQEKLGREQIAIVLPYQNKAFHQPVDFDGLKNMRSKLQAKLVIVAPYGSGPAEFARQRRFTYFTSLENYGRSLRDEKEASRLSRTDRWPFSRRQAKAQFSDTPASSAGEQISAPTSAADAATTGTAAPGAAALAADDSPAHNPADEGIMLSPPSQQDDAEDDVALPAPSALQADENTAVNSGAAQDSMQPPAAGPAPGGDIITFSARKRSTAELAAASPSSVVAADAQAAAPAAGISWQNSGKTPSAVTPMAGKAPVAPGGRITAKLPVVGGKPSGAGSTTPGGGRRRGGRLALLLLLLLASLTLCATVAIAAPATVPAPVHNLFSNIAGGGTPAATFTITPKSADELNTYVLTGVTSGTPDKAKRQVQVRQLKNIISPQSKTVPVTGVVDTPSVQATGSLTFYNGNGFAYTIKAQTVFTDASGVSVENNSALVVPAGSPAVGYGHITVAATAVTAGPRGNIRVGDFSLMQCCGSGSVFVTSSAFNGGQDPQHYTAVQQSDIDGAANPLKQPLMQSGLAAVNDMKHTNEQFVARPSCTSQVTSDQPVGAKATSITVTVSTTCTGVVYDQSAPQNIAADLLEKKAAQDLDSNYALAGNVLTSVTRTTTDPQGYLTLFVKAEGTWVYQFTDAQKTRLAQAITGKKKTDALAYLRQAPGVGQVGKVDITGGDGLTLPTDYKRISFVIVNASGVQGR